MDDIDVLDEGIFVSVDCTTVKNHTYPKKRITEEPIAGRDLNTDESMSEPRRRAM